MTASDCVRAALVTALGRAPVFAGVEGLAHDSVPTALPHVRVDPPVASDWGTKDKRGRELRTTIGLRVARGQALRLPSLIAAAEAAGEQLTGDLGGWGVASAVLIRSRSFDAVDGTRMATIEHRVRVLET